MQRMYFHEKLVESCYKLDFYFLRKNDTKKAALLYILTLAVFVGMLSSVFNIRDFYNSTNNLKAFVESNIPEFHVEGGKMVVDGPMSSGVIFSKDENISIIFDPSGSALNTYLTKTEAFYMNQYDFRIKNFNKEQIFSFKDANLLIYNKATLIEFVNMVQSPMVLAFGVLLVILFHIFILFLGFIIHYSLGNIINTLLKMPLTRQEVFPVTAYSITVPTLMYLIFIMLYWGSSSVLFMVSILTNVLVIGSVKLKLKQESE